MDETRYTDEQCAHMAEQLRITHAKLTDAYRSVFNETNRNIKLTEHNSDLANALLIERGRVANLNRQLDTCEAFNRDLCMANDNLRKSNKSTMEELLVANSRIEMLELTIRDKDAELIRCRAQILAADTSINVKN